MAAPALHVEVHGPVGAPGVVLAHGFGGSARNWRPQLRALRSRYRTAAYDARGHARSAAPDDPGAYRMDALVADLLRVGEATGDPRPVSCGLSLGAAVALRAVLAQPARVRALVLASHPAAPDAGHGIAARALAFAEAIERDGLEAAGAAFVWGPDSGVAPADAALVRRGFLEHTPHALVHTLRECLARLDPAEASLPSLRLPVLVIAGERDPASLPVSHRLAKAIPDARLVVIPDAGHVVNLVAAAAFDAALLGFLDGLPPG